MWPLRLCQGHLEENEPVKPVGHSHAALTHWPTRPLKGYSHGGFLPTMERGIADHVTSRFCEVAWPPRLYLGRLGSFDQEEQTPLCGEAVEL